MTTNTDDFAQHFERSRISAERLLDVLSSQHETPIDALCVVLITTAVLAYSVDMELDRLLEGISLAYGDIDSKMKEQIQ